METSNLLIEESRGLVNPIFLHTPRFEPRFVHSWPSECQDLAALIHMQCLYLRGIEIIVLSHGLANLAERSVFCLIQAQDQVLVSIPI